MNDITTIFTSYSLFWLLILAWVVIDALHRKMEIGAIVFWVLIVYFLSFLGLLLYVLNRPNEPARDELFGGPWNRGGKNQKQRQPQD